MLVYANHLAFPATTSVDKVIGTFASWLSHRVRISIHLDRMIAGIRSLRFRDGSSLTTTSTFVLGTDNLFPFLFNGTYSHNDTQTTGRRWTFEFGVRQFSPAATVECTILLKTDERSTLVRDPVEVTRPGLLNALIQLGPTDTTPGLQIRSLTLDRAAEFIADLERPDRRTPLVLLSANREGEYLAPLGELQSQLVGLCDIHVIPPDVDTRQLEVRIGRDRCAYGGVARYFWPLRVSDVNRSYGSALFFPPEHESANPTRYAQEANPILAAVTDHSNVPLSLRHISRERVNEQVLRSRLERAQSLKSNDESLPLEAELQILQDLLGSVDAEMRDKDQEAARLRDDVARLKAEAIKMQAIAAGYDRENTTSVGGMDLSAISSLREAILALHRGTVSLHQILDLIQALFPDRVIVLPSAFESATESDNARFQYGSKAADLLINLATSYWETLANGRGDQQAKECFGVQAYAANEKGLSARGRSERTFMYHGRMVEMDKHLKIGVRDSLTTTLRIHFEWFNDERKIVIGHCGRHLAL